MIHELLTGAGFATGVMIVVGIHRLIFRRPSAAELGLRRLCRELVK